MNFIKTTLIGGLIFLVPLIVLIVVIGQAIGVLIVVAEPIAELIPAETVAGIALVNLIALGAVILLCFLAGLVARSAAARKLTDMAESKVLQKIPGYTIIKGIASASKSSGSARSASSSISRDRRTPGRVLSTSSWRNRSGLLMSPSCRSSSMRNGSGRARTRCWPGSCSLPKHGAPAKLNQRAIFPRQTTSS
ncbi:MAG: hypothetical protein JRG96_14195 [Deltaproteobacteria bacterium]|nr:hypothetical protein [Deltaproteobacteria bacterium]